MSGVRRTGWVAVLGALAVLCAGGVAVAAGPSLRSYLLRSGEQPGYTVIKHSVRIQSTASSFARILGPFGWSSRHLKKAGFVAAAEELLRASHHRSGRSFVVRFTNRHAAVELARSWSDLFLLFGRPSDKNRFSAPGIAVSHGVIVRLRPTQAALLFWVEGDCMFLSGQDRRPTGRG